MMDAEVTIATYYGAPGTCSHSSRKARSPRHDPWRCPQLRSCKILPSVVEGSFTDNEMGNSPANCEFPIDRERTEGSVAESTAPISNAEVSGTQSKGIANTAMTSVVTTTPNAGQ
jgi:hypothetical protein